MLEPVEPRPQLEPEDAQRFDRQLLYLRQRAVHPETGPALQRRLRAARVVVLGCGGLGTWTAWSLATIGVGELVLVDPDTVDLSNLNRQILFGVDDIGRGKAVVASRRLKAFDPRLVARAVTDSVEGPRDVAALARGADLVVACADSPAYDIGRWINDGCNDAGVPHISAGQMPPIARVGPFVVPGETACVRCLELSVRRDNRLAGELEAKRKADPTPSATLGPVCGLIAAMIGADALHWLTGLGRPASWGTALTIDIRTLTVGREPVAPHRECGCCAQPK
jgi:bacteriocin biosynthesis cyclodehydratase domain-containing protein